MKVIQKRVEYAVFIDGTRYGAWFPTKVGAKEYKKALESVEYKGSEAAQKQERRK